MKEAASCHHDSGSFDEALRLYKRAADIFSHQLPTEATSLSIGMFHLFLCGYLLWMKEMRRDNLIVSLFALVNHNVALVYNEIGQNDKAVELMTESIKIKKQTLPENHPKIAQCQYLLLLV